MPPCPQSYYLARWSHWNGYSALPLLSMGYNHLAVHCWLIGPLLALTSIVSFSGGRINIGLRNTTHVLSLTLRRCAFLLPRSWCPEECGTKAPRRAKRRWDCARRGIGVLCRVLGLEVGSTPKWRGTLTGLWVGTWAWAMYSEVASRSDCQLGKLGRRPWRVAETATLY